MRYTYQVSYFKADDYQAIVRFYIDATDYDVSYKIAQARDMELRQKNPFFADAASTMCKCVNIAYGNRIIKIDD